MPENRTSILVYIQTVVDKLANEIYWCISIIIPVGRGGIINLPRSVFLCFYFFLRC